MKPTIALLAAALALPGSFSFAAAAPPAAPADEPNRDVSMYGSGVQGFQSWAKSTMNAISFRFQSSEEVWIATSDTYGQYPTQAMAARAASKYLEFDPTVDRMKVVLWRSNQRVAEATVDRGH